jgi:5-methylcytosine-specific restriction endonuclease McrA
VSSSARQKEPIRRLLTIESGERKNKATKHLTSRDPPKAIKKNWPTAVREQSLATGRLEDIERQQWKCQKGASLENQQVHHKNKRSHQGNDALENLVTLCAYCHMAEHGQLYFEPKATAPIKKPRGGSLATT